MKRSGKLAIGGVGSLVAVVAGVVGYANTAYTECFAAFESRRAAERAASRAERAGYEANVRHERAVSVVTFRSGESGRDASGFRRHFREIVEADQGELAHPGDGCLERAPFDH